MPFNAEDFMAMTTEGPMSTAFTPVPEGEYIARVGDGPEDVLAEMIQGKKDPTKQYLKLTLFWQIIDEALAAQLGRENIRVRDSFLIDVDETTGTLANGPDQNIRLGNRREALGLNSGSFSLNSLRGAGPCLIRVTQRSNPDDPATKYSEVRSAVRL